VAFVAELEAAGVRGPAARDAQRAVLMCIAGFLVGAWRPDDLAPPERRHAALWAAVDDDRIGPDTLEAMGEPPDLGRLFETTIAAVLDAYVPAGADRPRGSR
jgi:hypothetical protein